MSIGDFSARSGLSPKRLRSYAAIGLLTPAAVDPDTAYRYYSPGQLGDARLIDALRDAGIPLAEISVLLRERDPGAARRLGGASPGRRRAPARGARPGAGAAQPRPHPHPTSNRRTSHAVPGLRRTDRCRSGPREQ